MQSISNIINHHLIDWFEQSIKGFLKRTLNIKHYIYIYLTVTKREIKTSGNCRVFFIKIPHSSSSPLSMVYGANLISKIAWCLPKSKCQNSPHVFRFTKKFFLFLNLSLKNLKIGQDLLILVWFSYVYISYIWYMSLS